MLNETFPATYSKICCSFALRSKSRLIIFVGKIKTFSNTAFRSLMQVNWVFSSKVALSFSKVPNHVSLSILTFLKKCLMQSRKWSFRFGNCSIWFRSCSICSAKRPIGCENRISRSEGIKNILYILTDFLLRRISAVLSFPSIFSLLAGELWWTSVA